MELLRLEKTCKIIKFNHQPIITTPTDPHPSEHPPHLWLCHICVLSVRRKKCATNEENPSELPFLSLHPITSECLQLPALNPMPNPWEQTQGVIHEVTERREEWDHC